MSNHGSIESPEGKKLSDILGLGETGKFPQGKLNDTDEGEIKIAIAVENGKVSIHFGKPVAWVAFDKFQAMDIAIALSEKANQV